MLTAPPRPRAASGPSSPSALRLTAQDRRALNKRVEIDGHPADERAPDVGPGYPSGGHRIGPAWDATWRGLAGGEWVDMRMRSLEGSATLGVSSAALMSVMSQAARRGLLDTRREAGRLLVRRVSAGVLNPEPVDLGDPEPVEPAADDLTVAEKLSAAMQPRATTRRRTT
jgi:hypothetical protein